jgi:DNA repair ATPase RecN
LQWRKLDLHVHTPASKDYAGPPITPDQFVVKALAKGLHAIAITDHNSGEWIDAMVAAARGTALTIFPGVEISVPGGKNGSVHIVALFDCNATTKTIENLLSRLGFKANDYGSLEALSSMAPDAVVDAIHEAGGLAVLAHADSSKGVLADMVGQARNKVMNSDHLAAVEVLSVAKTAPFCSGKDQNYKRKLAYYRASDNHVPGGGSGHSVDAVGARYSWFKSDGLSLDALKQVFNDPDQRIKCDEESATIPDRMYPRILSLTVSQGFLKGMSFEFHEGLNSVIGGKGVGKSLLIEFLRFGLGQPSRIQDIDRDMNGKLAQQLRAGGQIVVRVQLEADQEIDIVRTYDGGPNPIKATYAISGKKVPGDIAQLFPVLAYSQTETLEIAKDPNAQLSLIDSFLDLVTIESRIAALEQALIKSDTAVAEAEAANEQLEKSEKELETLEEKIGQLDRAQKSKEFDALQALKPKSELMTKVDEFAEEIEAAVGGVADALNQCVVPKMPAALAEDRDVEKLRDELGVELKKLVANAREIEADVEKLAKRARRATSAWDKVVSMKKKEYERFVKTQGGERPALLVRKLALEEQKPGLAKNVSDLKSRIASLPKLRTERTRLLRELDGELEKRHEMRRQKYADLTTASHGRLELSLTKGGERSRYIELLSRLKTGSKLQEATVEQICAKVEPRALLGFVRNDDAAGLVKASGISSASATTLVGHLRASADTKGVLALDHGELLRDRPRIRYKKDDGQYYELNDLSVGQKCTALLIIALADGTRPIIIDQPEDALDITSVYQDVTLQLRERKHARQFIVTTHNPTVAVAADSDQFHVLSATASQASLTTEGAIDRLVVRKAVIQHLEGGEEPFALKTRKYGLGR